MPSAITQHPRSVDDLVKSVNDTLASWKSAFDVKPSDAASNASTRSPTSAAAATDKSPSKLWKEEQRIYLSQEAYRQRLETFRPDSYFAKPLALSPLVCAAFGWQNTDTDIIKCKHPKCNATLCIDFHPDLDKESHDNLCQKYLEMLASSHTEECPFQSFAGRWLKVMNRQCCRGAATGECNDPESLAVVEKETDEETIVSKTRQSLGGVSSGFYVPPYFLSLSSDFLIFEDCSGDGSITRGIVSENATQVKEKLQATIGDDAEFNVETPEAITRVCREILPGCDTCDVEHDKSISYVSKLLATFGWGISEGDSDAEESNSVVKCHLCLARSLLTVKQSSLEAPQKKRRIEITTNDAGIKLIDSHRMYCPYVSGFAFGAGHQTKLPGWKVVVLNLLKSSMKNAKSNLQVMKLSTCLYGDVRGSSH
ncbi:predicted protein [Thalassiosira pseudonana CCMP1335]|uniref:C3HC-type domain-containing protein n=1 Tax=Thalassiosira pseudonana TaxID=35128 RepID=B8BXA4_THAPS|nr:predicted protein [Thalassiosira pseudonana CCMP1335]EED94171.1 predicted protein [Thalassiosira pseudonana CCMP1335]